MISGKSFLSGYLHCNINLHSKFHVSSFSSLGSALICQQPPFHPFGGWFLKNPFLVVTYIIIGTYIPNFTFLALVVQALRWFDMSVSQFLLLYSTNWMPALRYGESVFSKESQTIVFFVVLAWLRKFWLTSKNYVYIDIYLPATYSAWNLCF